MAPTAFFITMQVNCCFISKLRKIRYESDPWQYDTIEGRKV